MTASMREVDPWRFTGSFIKKALLEVIPEEPSHPPIPWASVGKPLSQCRVSLLTTAVISMKDDTPFDMEGERKRPTWGDPTWRRIPLDATTADIAVNHLHIDTSYIESDLNVALPLDRLRDAVTQGWIGSAADHHILIMGYQGNSTRVLENETAPAIAQAMRDEEVDLAILAPV